MPFERDGAERRERERDSSLVPELLRAKLSGNVSRKVRSLGSFSFVKILDCRFEVRGKEMGPGARGWVL